MCDNLILTWSKNTKYITSQLTESIIQEMIKIIKGRKESISKLIISEAAMRRARVSPRTNQLTFCEHLICLLAMSGINFGSKLVAVLQKPFINSYAKHQQEVSVCFV